MNITFLFGNGLDIGMGLPTRYTDFYPVYCQKPSPNENIRKFKDTLREWNSGKAAQRIVNWSDFERAFGQHSADPSLTNAADYLERFYDFVLEFNKYLETVNKCVLIPSLKSFSQKLVKALSDCYNIRPIDRQKLTAFLHHHKNGRAYHFVSFNYTDTVDRCFLALQQRLKDEPFHSVGKRLHVHGYLTENMIIGVNDASQISNGTFSSDPNVAARLIKSQQIQASQEEYDRKMEQLINDSHLICVYGMSLGETDKKWWDMISWWLCNEKNRTLLILQHLEGYDPRWPREQPFADVVNTFLAHSSLSQTDKKAIRNRIFVGINNDVFAMNIFDKEKFDKEMSAK